MMNTVAFIPVRGGSKSIPGKNMKLFAGKPLVFWAAAAAQKCDAIERVYVATDSAEIRDVVSEFGLDKLEVIARSEQSATDNASSEVALEEFAAEYEFKRIVFLQATSPFTSSGDIQLALNQYNEGCYDSMLSVVRQKRFIWECSDNGARSVNYDYTQRPLRQHFDGYLLENGAIYINTRENILRDHNRLSGRIGLFEMCEESAIEIDEICDWIAAEQLFVNHKQSNPEEYSQCCLSDIDLLVLDVDGVLTDGSVNCSETGEATARFSRIDGKGVELFLASGRKVFVISAEDSDVVRKRLEKLHVENKLGVSDKLSVLNEYINTNGISIDRVAFVGDDVQDLQVMDAVAMSFCPRDARRKVLSHAD